MRSCKNKKPKQEMNRKNGIDLFRLIGAFFIVCIHTDYGKLNHEFVDNLKIFSRWAVPFFFITTGFFLSHKIENKTLLFKRIENNTATLISILLVTSLVYLPINLGLKAIPTIETLLAGSYFHLWFIGSLLFGYISIWYIYFVGISKILPYLSIFILLIALVSDSYDQFLRKDIDFVLFRTLLSIPFMYIGIELAKMKKNLANKKILISLIFIGFITQYFEAELLFKLFDYKKQAHQFLIGTIICSIPLFMLSSKIILRDNLLSNWGRLYSLFIYVYHPLVYIIVWKIATLLVPNQIENLKQFSPFIIFSVTISIAFFLNNRFPVIFKLLNGNFNFKKQH